MAVFQPSTGSGVTEMPGADVLNLLTVQPGKLGSVVKGDLGSGFVLVKIVLASQTDILPGYAVYIDKDYTAAALTTAASSVGQEVGFLQCWAPAAAAGTYYAWAGRSGHLAVQCTGSYVAAGLAESTATAGKVTFLAAGTTSSKAVSASLFAASGTFTANTVNGSPTLSNISQTAIADLCLGATITGTGIPASTIVGAIRRSGGTYLVDMVQSAAPKTPQNATATGTAVTVTFNGTLNAMAMNAWIYKLN